MRDAKFMLLIGCIVISCNPNDETVSTAHNPDTTQLSSSADNKIDLSQYKDYDLYYVNDVEKLKLSLSGSYEPKDIHVIQGKPDFSTLGNNSIYLDTDNKALPQRTDESIPLTFGSKA